VDFTLVELQIHAVENGDVFVGNLGAETLDLQNGSVAHRDLEL
jgi:hypothetical protein